jgi:hypothetical protein
MPTQQAGNGKWFIRPHHLETLTKHSLSIKDDVLNTRYYSHYNQQYGKKEERNDNAEAITKIEDHLSELKSKMNTMMMNKGKDPEFLTELHDKMRMEGNIEYERFINEKTRYDSK